MSNIDIDMSDAFILNMPMETGLKLMAPISPYCMDSERELLYYIISLVSD